MTVGVSVFSPDPRIRSRTCVTRVRSPNIHGPRRSKVEETYFLISCINYYLTCSFNFYEFPDI